MLSVPDESACAELRIDRAGRARPAAGGGNGHARRREVLTAAGAVGVRAPRVDDRRVDPVTGERARFRSVILPPWCRKSPKVAEVLPLLLVFKLLESAQDRWRAVNGPHLVALVRAGAPFDKG